jgi:hypothetical protein
VGNAPTEVATVGANGFQGFDHGDHQFGEIMGLAIREALLGQLPDALIGVELRRIGREALQVEPRGVSAKLTYELAAMGVCAVPQNDDVPGELPEQLPQEVAGLELSDVLLVELKVKVEALAAGRNRDPRDGGDPVASIEVMNRGRLAHGSPGAGDGGCQLEARLVGEDEVGTQPFGVFFTRGQSSRMKRRISALFRSSAFFCGFWWLHPKACRSLPT